MLPCPINIQLYVDYQNVIGFTGEVDPSIIDEVYIDLDGVTADFQEGMDRTGLEADEFKLRPGSYVWLPPIEGAKEAIQHLWNRFPGRVWFLTKPPKFSPYAYVEKALWYSITSVMMGCIN
jgi:hypothetical protein